ncbi:hypothetical protein CR513_35461, partial [Mucuna pruriens]
MQAESDFTNQTQVKSDSSDQMKVESDSSSHPKAESDSDNQSQKQIEVESDFGRLIPHPNRVDQPNPRSASNISPPHSPLDELKPLPDHLKHAYLDDHQHFLVIIANNLHWEGSLTNRATIETTESDHLGCRQERRYEATCSQDHLSYIGQPVGQSGTGSSKERVCIDYRKLNQVTRKDHFPLPFIDQVLERSIGKSHYCFLDGFFGYMQIHIVPADQHKTTFTCPFGTFAYTRMSFGLCNTPSTFQRCMISIFSDLLENCMEVFMDDLIVYGELFDTCLENFSRVLTRCIDTNLVLNFEKCHSIVIEGIVLGHLVSSRGIEVDKAKVDIIASLSYPASVQEYPFELMCDASNSTLGAILGQRVGKQSHVIAYASRTMDLAQMNYTTTEKELLAIIFALDKFRSYLLGSKIIIFSDHAALKFLLKKPNAKLRLIRDKKGVENSVLDHLSRIEKGIDLLSIRDDFPDK